MKLTALEAGGTATRNRKREEERERERLERRERERDERDERARERESERERERGERGSLHEHEKPLVLDLVLREFTKGGLVKGGLAIHVLSLCYYC